MTNIIPFASSNPEGAATLIGNVPAATADFDRANMLASLPDILDGALSYLLDDPDAIDGNSSYAVGCRIIAAVIDRLRG